MVSEFSTLYRLLWPFAPVKPFEIGGFSTRYGYLAWVMTDRGSTYGGEVQIVAGRPLPYAVYYFEAAENPREFIAAWDLFDGGWES